MAPAKPAASMSCRLELLRSSQNMTVAVRRVAANIFAILPDGDRESRAEQKASSGHPAAPPLSRVGEDCAINQRFNRALLIEETAPASRWSGVERC